MGAGMGSRYRKGQKVIIKAGDDGSPCLRDSTLENYEGHLGKIVDYYWISVGRGSEVFYVYQVKMEADSELIAVHEDELDLAIE
jgi:hypothetical protein